MRAYLHRFVVSGQSGGYARSLKSPGLWDATCPDPFRPQQITVVSVITAHVWKSPAAADLTVAVVPPPPPPPPGPLADAAAETDRYNLRFAGVASPAILAAAVLALPACGGEDQQSSSGASETTPPAGNAPSGAEGVSAISVNAIEYALDASPTDGRAGDLTFELKNAGAIVHEFVVIKTDKPADQLLKGAEADEAGAVDEVQDIKPGESKKLTVKLAPGHYALICNLPGHYMPGGKPGMLAYFTVE